MPGCPNFEIETFDFKIGGRKGPKKAEEKMARVPFFS
jgi:hypothetical protein